jgi:hypothetical protein
MVRKEEIFDLLKEIKEKLWIWELSQWV